MIASPISLDLDFTQPQWLYRLQHASKRSEFIIRAMGPGDRSQTKIIDATAGLGQDSLLLAAVGYQVTMIERSAVVHNLLSNALIKAQTHPGLMPHIKRLTLHHCDAISYLQQSVKPSADIIYLDPMFPAKQKNAASKKEMQFLQSLLGHEIDNGQELFAMALTCAKKRVVVKRPRLAKPIANLKPQFSLVGKSSRFDVYIITT